MKSPQLSSAGKSLYTESKMEAATSHVQNAIPAMYALGSVSFRQGNRCSERALMRIESLTLGSGIVIKSEVMVAAELYTQTT